ncbi:hypothetical protein Hypma_006955 [Hypsizygus marmoreus]|uniref:Uncharacterized protein n=1 Tax=Hypsizygus marmoreus TaxID=39966 RepID=A0A369K0N4_HYPMA|nr:hypothetical protein Hypma_006955 [Hypsizygus marmoreus]
MVRSSLLNHCYEASRSDYPHLLSVQKTTSLVPRSSWQ